AASGRRAVRAERDAPQGPCRSGASGGARRRPAAARPAAVESAHRRAPTRRRAPSLRPLALGLFRLRLPDGSIRLACGEAKSGPSELLAEGLTIEAILGLGEGGLAEALQAHVTGETPPSASVAPAPVDTRG